MKFEFGCSFECGFCVPLQNRATQLLAEYLLDVNASRQAQTDISEEYKANLEANVADSIAILPKLTTGVDVNVRFNGIRSFEFTQETAVFDILDIPLVHGWIVDPQDPAASALGSRSYNDVVMRIVDTLGASDSQKYVARCESLSSRRNTSCKPQPSISDDNENHELDAIRDEEGSTSKKQNPIFTAEMLNKALEASLPHNRETIAASPTTSDTQLAANIDHLLDQVVKSAFKTPESEVMKKKKELRDSKSHDLDFSSDILDSGPCVPEQHLLDFPPEEEDDMQQDMTLKPSTNVEGKVQEQTYVDDGETALPVPHRKDEDERDAFLMRDFLDANPSQLTFHGLSTLIDELSDKSLSVFFRNNHFNVLLRSNRGLFMLVTDQGYLYEHDVVWEHLCDVSGDTQLVQWDLKPFKAHTGGNKSSGRLIPDNNEGQDRRIGYLNEASTGEHRVIKQTESELDDHPRQQLHSGGVDADLALAMQLQEEENARARLEDSTHDSETPTSYSRGNRYVQTPQERFQSQQCSPRPGRSALIDEGEAKKKCSIM